jgi:hypothetical protein
MKRRFEDPGRCHAYKRISCERYSALAALMTDFYFFSDFSSVKNFFGECPLLSLLRSFRFPNRNPNQSIQKEITVIHQISDIKTRTGASTQIDRGLIRVRHIQSYLKERFATGRVPSHIELCDPFLHGSCLVRVTRWIE